MPTPAELILAKTLLPTHLSSRGIREMWSAELRARALFSARTAELGYIERLRELLAAVAGGRIGEADFRMHAQRHLDAMGYDPGAEGAEPGAMGDRAGETRLRLILDTNVRMARSAAQEARSADPALLRRYPAWRLERTGSRRVPRQDWAGRWHAAGEAVDWAGAIRGEMVALKGSPIWAALGAGAGGYNDALGAPRPPFAFGSGLGWTDVDADEAAALGLKPGGDSAAPAPGLAPGRNEYQQAYDRLPPDMQAAARAWLEGGGE